MKFFGQKFAGARYLGLSIPPLLFAMLVITRILFPDYSSFVNDEPNLQNLVTQAMQNGKIPLVGLSGSQPIPYGPAPTILYAIARLISNNHTWVWTYHAFFQILAFALVWVVFNSRYGKRTGTLGILPWVVSPFLVLYSRIIWDNTWLIVFSSLQFWCCHRLDVQSRHSASKSAKLRFVGLSGFLASVMVSTHLIAIPFSFCALLFCLYATTEQSGKTFDQSGVRTLLATGALWLGVCSIGLCPYFLYVWSKLGLSMFAIATQGGHSLSATKLWEVVSTLGSLNDSNYFANFIFRGSVESWRSIEVQRPFLKPAMVISGSLSHLMPFSCLLLFLGALSFSPQKMRNWFRHHSLEFFIGLLPVIFTIILQWKKNLPQYPHYYHFIWWCPLLCGLSYFNRAAQPRQRILIAFMAVLFVCNSYALFTFMSFVGDAGGTRGLEFGAVIKTQKELINSICHSAKLKGVQLINVDTSAVAILATSLDYFASAEPLCKNLGIQFNSGGMPVCRITYDAEPQFSAHMTANCLGFD